MTATSLTGVGLLVEAPVPAVAALSGSAYTGLSVINKKLELKVNKHSRIHALAVAKRDSINSYVSQALDNLVSDMEVKLITHEMQKYRQQLKETLGSNFKQKQTNSRYPDL